MLHAIDQAVPDDKDSDAAQAIKHDLLETPAAILNARKDIKELRGRGRRLFFENKGRSVRAGGRRKDRLLRRGLDSGYIATQAATNMMPGEYRDEDSGTRGIRTMVAEGAKLIKVIATAEKKPKKSKMRFMEDEQRLVHENTPEASRLEHEAPDADNDVLRHEEADAPDGGSSLEHEDSGGTLRHEDSDAAETPDGNPDATSTCDCGTERTGNPGSRPDADNIGYQSPRNQDFECNTEQDSSNFHINDTRTETRTDTNTGTSTGNPQVADSGESYEKSKSDIKCENKLDHNIEKYTARAEKLQKQIEKAEAKIPKEKVKTSKLVHDPETGKTKRKISFSDENVGMADAKWNQGQNRTLSANAGQYVTGHASSFVHGKISETENLTGNTGVKAAHTGEKMLERGYSAGKKIHQYVRNAPYRRLNHLKAKEVQNKGKLAYQKLLKEKPELRKKPISRLLQRRRIKKEYAKAFRAAQSGAGAAKTGAFGKMGAALGIGAAAVSGDMKALAKMGAQLGLRVAFKKAAMAFAKAAIPVLLKIGAFVLIIAAILMLFTMCVSLIGTATGQALDAISYQADMDDITKYSVYMTQLEVELKEEIMEAAEDLDGLHEFRFVLTSPSGNVEVIFEGTLVTPGLGHPYFILPVYSPLDFDPIILLEFLTDITHNPFEIMAYLTAMYGNFEGYDIKAILREVFETAFTLSITDGYEVRSAYVEAWYFELQDLGGYEDFGSFEDFGGYDDDDNWVSDMQWVSDWQWVSNWQYVRVPPYMEIMYYNWYYREVALTVNMTVSEVIQSRLSGNPDVLEHYEYLMKSLGLRQFVGSPFKDNWLGNVTSIFGYRFHPVTLTREMHTGIDIGKPEGTPISGGVSNAVVITAGDMGGYGLTVIIEYIDSETGKGVRVLYAHMATIDVLVGDVLEMGQVIGTVGQTGVATGPHLHLEISITEDSGGTWRLLNPIFFAEPYQSGDGGDD